MDVNVRQTICTTSYEYIWGEADLETKFDPSKCINCESCTAELVCPMRAITFEGNRVKRIKERCFNCGLCITSVLAVPLEETLEQSTLKARRYRSFFANRIGLGQ